MSNKTLFIRVKTYALYAVLFYNYYRLKIYSCLLFDTYLGGNMIHIVTDATTDFPKQFYEKDFTVLPMGYMLDDEDFDGETKTITAKEFYDYMRAGRKTNTRMVDEATILKYVEPLLKEGKDVLYVVFSSGLSGTYDNAVRVFKELHEKYPACKLAAVDSYNASMGEGLLVWYTLKKRAEGASFEELCKYVEDTQAHLCSYFTVDDLKHLARLGRVTKTAAFIGSLANIKPVLFVNSKGKLIPIAKVVSRKKSLKALVDKMEEKMLPVSEQKKIFIGHGDCYDDAVFVKNEIEKRFGLDCVVIDYIGPVIGAHAGAGVVALFFLGTDKFEKNDTSED